MFTITLFGVTAGIALLAGFVGFLDELHKAADPKEPIRTYQTLRGC